MRWYILRTLLHKEALRHLANRGGIVLVLLLVVASMLLSFFGSKNGPGGGSFVPSVQLCYIDYASDGPLIDHLRANVPADLVRHVRFRSLSRAAVDGQGRILYPHNAGAIQLRPPTRAGSEYLVSIWQPGSDASGMAPFEVWFWKESFRFVQAQRGVATGEERAAFEEERASLAGGLDPRSGLATALVLFGMFFVCVYLLPSLTCEERERGVLLAQALSPASTAELLTARFLFYPIIGLILAATLASTYDPSVLTKPFFWMALVVVVMGSMGIGLTIASIARTQRAASMGAMTYMMAVALLLFICQQNHIPGLPYLALEYHGPRMLHAALTDNVLWYHWMHLFAAAVLAVGWALIAGVLFRRRGWQ